MVKVFKLSLFLFFFNNLFSTTNCIDDCLEEIGGDSPRSVVTCIKNCHGDCKNGLVYIHGPDMIKEPTCCD